MAGGNGEGKKSNQLDDPQGVYLDMLSNIYISDYMNDRIQKWEAGADTGITVAGGYGSGPTNLIGPFGVYLNSANDIYVSDVQNARVQEFIPGNTAPLIDTTYRPTFGGMYNVTAVFADGCTVTSESVHIKGLPRFRRIEGQKRNLCDGGTFGYSVKGDDKTFDYTWTAPEGCTILSGQGTDSITLSIPATGFVEGTLSVFGENRCGTGPATTATLSTKPDQPGEIHGPTEVGYYDTLTYWVEPEEGMNYRWIFPDGVTIISGQNTPAVTVAWTSILNGNVILKASVCGAESSRRLAVTAGDGFVKGSAGDKISSKTANSRLIKIVPNPVTHTATVSFTAAKSGKYTLQVRDLAGRGMLRQNGEAVAGENKVLLDAGRLTSGNYFIEIWLGSESIRLNQHFEKF